MGLLRALGLQPRSPLATNIPVPAGIMERILRLPEAERAGVTYRTKPSEAAAVLQQLFGDEIDAERAVRGMRSPEVFSQFIPPELEKIGEGLASVAAKTPEGDVLKFFQQKVPPVPLFDEYAQPTLVANVPTKEDRIFGLVRQPYAAPLTESDIELWRKLENSMNRKGLFDYVEDIRGPLGDKPARNVGVLSEDPRRAAIYDLDSWDGPHTSQFVRRGELTSLQRRAILAAAIASVAASGGANA